MGRELSSARVLIIDDDEPLLARLRAALEPEVGEVRVCTGCRAALELLGGFTPDVLVLDVVLAEGDAFAVLQALDARRARPAVVAISGAASPAQSFRLARQGVQRFLSKPFGVDELLEAVERALREPIDLEPLVRDAVGKRPLAEVEAEVRRTMVDEALARSRGVRAGAARLLAISRQLLQHILRTRRGA